jgi:hypothetical protein
VQIGVDTTKPYPIWPSHRQLSHEKFDLVAPDDDGVIACSDEKMELFVWWWDEILPCTRAPNTEFWTNEKWWYHCIHDGRVGNEPLLTPQDGTSAFLCFKNYQ